MTTITLTSADVAGVRYGWRLDLVMRRVDTLQFAVVSDTGSIWDLVPTRLGAARRLRRHERKSYAAPNHHPQSPAVVELAPGQLRQLVIDAATATLLRAVEAERWTAAEYTPPLVNGEPLVNGGLRSSGAIAAAKALKMAQRGGRPATVAA